MFIKNISRPLVLIVLSVLLFERSSTAYAPKFDLKSRWQCELKNRKACVRPATLTTLQDRHVIFIPGFLNELILGPVKYFKSNSIALSRDLKGNFTLLRSRSWKSIHENSEDLLERVKKEHHRTKKPLILFAHSKGAAEALYLVLKHPDLILDGVVDRLILVQAAVGGTPFAYALKSGYTARLFNTLLGTGLKSMHPDSVNKEFWKASVHFMNYLGKRFPSAKAAEAQKTISDRIFYVRSSTNDQFLNPASRFIGGYFRMDLRWYGLNDGVLLTEEQRLPWIGRDLGVLEADHGALTIDGYNHGMPHEREALTRALFDEVLNSEIEIEVEIKGKVTEAWGTERSAPQHNYSP